MTAARSAAALSDEERDALERWVGSSVVPRRRCGSALSHPRFQLHFTPTGSSWLNLVERWFAEPTGKQIRRGAHKTVQHLETDIPTWIAAWNTDPETYIWTRTADEILERLASYI